MYPVPMVCGHWNDDLFFCFVECFEGMEEFFLRRFLFSQKLDIVNEQDIDVAVFIAKGFCCIVLDGIDQFIGESLTGCIRIFISGWSW